MQRREFLASSLVASGLAAEVSARSAQAQQTEKRSPLFIQVRHYMLGPVGNAKLCDDFFRDALIPAANRLGISPVGVFNGWFGPDTATKWVLLVGPSLETVATLETHLSRDPEYMKTAAPFLNAPVAQPPFSRMESSLLQTLPELPGVAVPAALAKAEKRIYELRTYVQPTYLSHDLKADLFQAGGEAESLNKAGLNGVFFAENLIGSGIPGSSLPGITYMWAYASLADRQKGEEVWGASPETHAVMGNPKYAGVPSVISNIILRPAPYSQL
jgi:hypothetical protein